MVIKNGYGFMGFVLILANAFVGTMKIIDGKLDAVPYAVVGFLSSLILFIMNVGKARN